MDIETRAGEILDIQRSALDMLEITPAMTQAIEKLVQARNDGGHVITTGMGKAGIIAMKMSATLASIGLPSFFVSPAEAGHGDLGRIAAGDLIVVFSNSGTTAEVIAMINHVHALNGGSNYVIVIGGSDEPKIPADLVVNYGAVAKSCVVEKVPSTSTTLMLVLADILSITAAEALGLDDETFKARHPGGAIGEAYKKNT